MSIQRYLVFRTCTETTLMKAVFALLFGLGGLLGYLATDSLVPFAAEAARQGEFVDGAIPASADELVGGRGVRAFASLFVYQLATCFGIFVALSSARLHSNGTYHWLASELSDRQRLFARELWLVTAGALSAGALTVLGAVVGYVVRWPGGPRSLGAALSAGSLGNYLLAFFALTACYFGFGLFALLAAHLTKSSAAAIALAIMLPLFVEPLIVAEVPWTENAMPATILTEGVRSILRTGSWLVESLRLTMVCSILALLGAVRFSTVEMR